MSKKGLTAFRLRAGISKTVTDGNTPQILEGLKPGDWRIIVTELDVDFQSTKKLGCADFIITEMDSPSSLTVEVSDDRVIEGIVQRADTGEVVPNASVHLDADLTGAPHQYTTTDSQGRFLFEDVAMATYQIWAKTDTLEMTEIVHLVDGGNIDKPTIVKLLPGATIFGKVTGPDGSSLADCTVALEMQWWGGSRGLETTTDRQGQYELKNLPIHIFEVVVKGTGVNHQVSTSLFPSPGQRREVNFDLSEQITVSGQMLLGGTPWTYVGNLGPHQRPAIHFTPYIYDNPTTRHASMRWNATQVAPGRYEAHLSPGTYLVGLLNDHIFAETGLTLTVPPDSGDFTYDINIPLADICIVLSPSKEFEIKPGKISIEHRVNDYTTRAWFPQAINSDSQILSNMHEGEYKFLFEDNEATMQGESEWIPVVAGDKNNIIIDVYPSQEKTYELTITMPTGEHQYKYFIMPDRWIDEDPLNPVKALSANNWNPAFNVPEGAVQNDGTVSPYPKVNPKTNEVTFRITTSTALDNVYVRGNFTGWQINGRYKMHPVD